VFSKKKEIGAIIHHGNGLLRIFAIPSSWRFAARNAEPTGAESKEPLPSFCLQAIFILVFFYLACFSRKEKI